MSPLPPSPQKCFSSPLSYIHAHILHLFTYLLEHSQSIIEYRTAHFQSLIAYTRTLPHSLTESHSTIDWATEARLITTATVLGCTITFTAIHIEKTHPEFFTLPEWVLVLAGKVRDLVMRPWVVEVVERVQRRVWGPGRRREMRPRRVYVCGPGRKKVLGGGEGGDSGEEEDSEDGESENEDEEDENEDETEEEEEEEEEEDQENKKDTPTSDPRFPLDCCRQ